MPSILFIANPLAGGRSKKHIISTVEHEMKDSGYDWSIRYTEYAGHATELASSTEAGTVVAIGGDGTVDEVAKALVGTQKTLGIIPCGSGDGLARHMHISHIPEFALRTVKEGQTVSIDYGLINGKPFFCTCGVGLDAAVSAEFAKAGKRGLRTYIEKALETWSGFKPEEYELVIDGDRICTKAVLITAANANQWGNEGRIAPMASLCDGLLDVTVIEPFHNVEIPLLAAMLMDGHLDHNGRVKCYKCKSLTIHREKEGPAHFDGDPFDTGREIHIEIVPEALKVIVPERYMKKI